MKVHIVQSYHKGHTEVVEVYRQEVHAKQHVQSVAERNGWTQKVGDPADKKGSQMKIIGFCNDDQTEAIISLPYEVK